MPDSNVLFLFGEPEVSVRGAVPGLGAHVGTRAVEIAEATIRNGLSSAVSAAGRMFESAAQYGGEFQLDEVKVGLGVSANGEVGFLGAAKGGVGAEVTFELTFRRRNS
jgi:hypothetical protein